MIRLCCLLLCMTTVGLTGCGGEKPFRKPTSVVTGKVTVDGVAPTSAITIECHPVNGMDAKHPTVSQTVTGPEGTFKISTYEAGDGVPAGDYVLTLYWGEFNLMSNSYSGPDKLKDRYRDPKTSEIKLTVKEGKPTDLGTIVITTK